MRGGRAKLKAGFWFNIKKYPIPESGDASLPKKPNLDPKLDGHHGGRKLAGGASVSTTDRSKKRGHGAVFLIIYSLQLYKNHLHLLCRLVHFQNSYISAEAILLIGLCLCVASISP